jgi:hypothetical protein
MPQAATDQEPATTPAAAIEQDPALALNARGRYWYFSMAALGADGGEATPSAIEGKVQHVLGTAGMHTMMWEQMDTHKQVESLTNPESGHSEATLFKTAIVVHGILRWGGDVRGRTLQKDVFGLSAPRTTLSLAPGALTQELGKANGGGHTISPERAAAAIEAARLFLERQRPAALEPHLVAGVSEATHLGPWAKHGPKGAADPRRWGGSDYECAEGGDMADEDGNHDSSKKTDERLLEIKEMIDSGDCELGDIREGYYVDYLRHASAFRADIAHNKEAAINMTTVEYSNLNGWQRECVDLATQTEADMRSIHWYVDEDGGKVSQTPFSVSCIEHISVINNHPSALSTP